jgi:predicted DNA binding protein
MKKGRKNLIKRLHADSHPSYKGELEKEFPKLFKEDALVVGKWYKSEIAIFKVTSLAPLKSYGVYSGKWGNEFYTDITTKLRLATDKEVGQALIKEAKKKGFVKGVLISNENMGYHYKGMGYSYKGMCSSNKITFKHGVLSIDNIFIMKDGKWATIIKETITKEQAEKAKEVLAQYNKQ